MEKPPAQKVSDIDARHAMRSYLQRMEVRLSTMHRIPSAFLGGAGILILFPVFFSQAIAVIVKLLFDQATDIWHTLTTACLAGPVFFSLAIPIYALYLLLRDLVHFYFVGPSPGFPTRFFNPRFVLSGIAFSTDESEDAKKAVKISQYSSDLINFILPFGEAQAAYLDAVIESTNEQIIPVERKIDNLIAAGVLAKADGSQEVVIVQSDPPERREIVDIKRFNAELGLAGFRDRSLIAEVAKAEVSLVRHATALRRLLLRYLKALLLFILTSLISFVLVALAQPGKIPPLILFALGYLAWSAVMRWIVTRPIKWIYDTGDPRSENVVPHDSKLVEFETKVGFVQWLSLGLSAIALVLSVIATYKVK